MFILNLTYKKSLDEVNKWLPEHNTYLKKYYESNNFICSGRKEPRTGGIILCTFDNIEEVKSAIQNDPFLQQEIAEYEITQFTPTKSNDQFQSVFN